jgi:lysine-N-methylase
VADHVALRRHLVDGREHIFAHDLHTEETFPLDRRQLRLLGCADGTRDLGGVVLAAVRCGAYRRSSELLELLGKLHERGMLADGIEVGEPRRSPAPARPLAVLADFTLRCDHNATCCGTYGGVVFSRTECARAETLVPDALAQLDGRDDRFLPVRSSAPGPYETAPMVDGHCPFLDAAGLCRIQAAGGPTAKPLGCQLFPATFVDDGQQVRVSVLVECPCVLASIGAVDGSSLVPAGARVEGDLLAGTPVIRLPDTLPLAADRAGTPAELSRWSHVLCERVAGVVDPLAALWSLADAVRDYGLALEPSLQAVDAPAVPDEAALAFPLMALSGRAAAKLEAVRSWRSERDRTQQLAVWLAAGAQALLEPTRVEQALAGAELHRRHERFYLQATLFGHHLAIEPVPLDRALRDRATRLLLARQLAHDVPDECASHPAVPYPLTAVESMMRAQGLSAYTRG